MNQVVSSFLMMVKKFYRAIIVQIVLYKCKKPLKIKRLTTVIVLKAGLEPSLFDLYSGPFQTQQTPSKLTK